MPVQKSHGIAALAILVGSPAFAGCYTSSPSCAGVATFQNFTQSTNCASVRSPKGAFNFCVPANGSVDKQVPPYSRFCWSGGNYAPQTNCDLQWIYVPNPSQPAGS